MISKSVGQCLLYPWRWQTFGRLRRYRWNLVGGRREGQLQSHHGSMRWEIVGYIYQASGRRGPEKWPGQILGTVCEAI